MRLDNNILFYIGISFAQDEETTNNTKIAETHNLNRHCTYYLAVTFESNHNVSYI